MCASDPNKSSNYTHRYKAEIIPTLHFVCIVWYKVL